MMTLGADERKQVARDRAAQWYSKHRDEVIKRRRKKRADNPEVYREAKRKWYAEHREQERERANARRAANPEKFRQRDRARYAADPLKRREATRHWRDDNPERVRENRLRWFYGLTADGVRAMLAAQDGVCAGCRKPLAWPAAGTHIDHDHATGRVRGILCHHCNHKVDKHATPAILRRLADYLTEVPDGNGSAL